MSQREGALPQDNRAVNRILEVAETGDASAQCQLGNWYLLGEKVPRDVKKAIDWYEKAEKSGSAMAGQMLAAIFEEGRGVPVDMGRARELYDRYFSRIDMNVYIRYIADLRAAEHENLDGASHFIKRIAASLAVPMTDGEKQAFFARNLRRARRGNVLAAFRTGVCYEQGEGVPADLDEAFFWYLKAADQGVKQAESALAGLYEHGVGTQDGREKVRPLVERLTAKRLADDKVITPYADWENPTCFFLGAATIGSVYRLPRLGDVAGMDLSACQKMADAGNCIARCVMGIAYRRGVGVPVDLERAKSHFEAAADGGLTEALANLGVLFHDGGLKDDFRRAKGYWKKAAAAGDATSMFCLGVLCEDARYGRSNINRAFSWYEKAAYAGSVSGQIALARFYCMMIARERDLDQAFFWMRQAALAGRPDAQYGFGLMYAEGIGVAVNMNDAIRWCRLAAAGGESRAAQWLRTIEDADFGEPGGDSVARFEAVRRAAERGNHRAQYELGNLYRTGQGVSPHQLRAFYWYQKAAKSGLADAQNNLGMMYWYGYGVAPDLAQAIFWFKKAADAGDMTAMYNLGAIHDVDGPQPDARQAIFWWTQGAEGGEKMAQFNLANLYEDGDENGPDIAKAIYWYEQAADQGERRAFFHLAEIYRTGKFVREDPKRAFDLNMRAACKEVARAQFSQGQMFETGYSCRADMAKARFWYERAAFHGFTRAREALERINLEEST